MAIKHVERVKYIFTLKNIFPSEVKFADRERKERNLEQTRFERKNKNKGTFF